MTVIRFWCNSQLFARDRGPYTFVDMVSSYYTLYLHWSMCSCRVGDYFDPTFIINGKAHTYVSLNSIRPQIVSTWIHMLKLLQIPLEKIRYFTVSSLYPQWQYSVATIKVAHTCIWAVLSVKNINTVKLPASLKQQKQTAFCRETPFGHVNLLSSKLTASAHHPYTTPATGEYMTF